MPGTGNRNLLLPFVVVEKTRHDFGSNDQGMIKQGMKTPLFLIKTVWSGIQCPVQVAVEVWRVLMLQASWRLSHMHINCSKPVWKYSRRPVEIVACAKII